MSTSFVVCAACGTRIKACRERCLRCGERLFEQGAPPRTPLWVSLGLSREQILVLRAAASLAVLGLLAVIWKTRAEPLDDVVRPAIPQALSTPQAAPVASASAQTPGSEGSAPPFGPPTFVDASRGGVASFVARNFEAARAAYEEALARRPDDADTQNKLGQVLVRLGHVDEAVPRFERAVTLAPDEPTYHFNLAHAAGQLGRWDRAIDEYLEAVRRSPDDYATRYNLAMALYKKGNEQAAIPEFRKAIQLAPGEASFHVSLGLSLERAGRVADAVREYRQYLDMEPSSPHADKLEARIEALSSAPSAGRGPREP